MYSRLHGDRYINVYSTCICVGYIYILWVNDREREREAHRQKGHWVKSQLVTKNERGTIQSIHAQCYVSYYLYYSQERPFWTLWLRRRWLYGLDFNWKVDDDDDDVRLRVKWSRLYDRSEPNAESGQEGNGIEFPFLGNSLSSSSMMLLMMAS